MARTYYTVRQALKRAEEIRARHPTYSMPNRGNTMYSPLYDCSSFIGVIWGVGLGGWPPATPAMRSAYVAAGFETYDRGQVTLKQGDILVDPDPGGEGHTAMVYNKEANILIECTSSANGISVGNGVYYFPWTQILRGRRGIEIARWTGENPWHKIGY